MRGLGRVFWDVQGKQSRGWRLKGEEGWGESVGRASERGDLSPNWLNLDLMHNIRSLVGWSQL